MVVFSGVLDTGQVEDQKMIKDKLIDGKKLLVDLEVNMMIIQFSLKLGKFYCIGGMN